MSVSFLRSGGEKREGERGSCFSLACLFCFSFWIEGGDRDGLFSLHTRDLGRKREGEEKGRAREGRGEKEASSARTTDESRRERRRARRVSSPKLERRAKR